MVFRFSPYFVQERGGSTFSMYFVQENSGWKIVVSCFSLQFLSFPMFDASQVTGGYPSTARLAKRSYRRRWVEVLAATWRRCRDPLECGCLFPPEDHENHEIVSLECCFFS